MADQNDWYRVLTLARIIAANDLRVSNEILDISDSLKIATKNGKLTEEEISEITNKLVQKSLELSDSSKNLNHAITKLMGVV
jgi:hypothetical protein